MKPLVALSLLALSLTVVGAGCAADKPRDDEPAPAPAPAEAKNQRGQLAPPPSALRGALLVLNQARETGSAWIRLRRLESRSVQGQGDRPDRVHVKLDFHIVGSDALQATARYVSLLDALSASAWCENVQRAPTRVIEAEAALEVIGLEVLLLPADSDWQAGEPTEDPELIARDIAAGMGLGGLDARVSSRRPARGVTDTIYHVRPSDRRTPHSLATILEFLTPLEDRTANMNVTGIELKTIRRARAKDPLDQWTFQIQLTSRFETQP